jgi:hypothetical protein
MAPKTLKMSANFVPIFIINCTVGLFRVPHGQKHLCQIFFHLKKNLNLAILMEKQKYFFNLLAKSDIFAAPGYHQILNNFSPKES